MAKTKEEDKSFLDIQKEKMDVLGFWTEEYRSVMIARIESMYKKEIIRVWGISDIVMNGDKMLLKWYKRHQPLTDEELKEDYNL